MEKNVIVSLQSRINNFYSIDKKKIKDHDNTQLFRIV